MTAIDGTSVARPQPAAGRLVAAAFAVPPLALLAVAVGLALRGGGAASEEWQPVAVGLVTSLLVLTLVGAVPGIPRAAWPMLAGLAALLAWNAASLLWSELREATAENVVRLLMLAAAAVIGAAYAARPRAALALAGGLALYAGLAAGLIELKLLTDDAGAFAGSRLSWPINYANADAALVWLPLPALLAFAAARRLPPPARGLFGFAAALAFAVGLTTESRGAAIALAGALVAAVVIARDRGRFALTLLAVVVPDAAAARWLLEAGSGGARTAGVAALAAAGVAGALVCALAVLDRRGRAPFGGRESRVAVIAWAVVLALGVAAFAVAAGRPDTWLQARWSEFRNVHPAPTGDVSHFGTGFSNRYDYWRVAWRTFEAHPVEGVGSGAFSVPWFRSRSIDENVTDAHSWQAGTLAETGLVGLALAAAVLLLPLAAVRHARRGDGAWPIAAVGLGGAGVYFVLHASIDWLFRIPAIAVPGFVVLGALATAGRAGPSSLARGPERIVLAFATLLAAAAVVPTYLSTRETSQAAQHAATSTDDALGALDTAARLNPFAAEPLIVRAAILAGDGRAAEAVRAAEEATRRAPNSASAWRALADARLAAGRAAAARLALGRAAELDPRAARPQQAQG